MKQTIPLIAVFVIGIVTGFVLDTPAVNSNEPAESIIGKYVTSGPVYEGQEKMLDAFVLALKTGDAKGSTACYTKDAYYLQPQIPAQKGEAEILAGYEEYYKTRTDKVIEVEEPIAEVISFGDWAVLRGTGKDVSESSDGNRTTKTYKWMILSQKQADGSWKMKWDMYNYDADYSAD